MQDANSTNQAPINTPIQDLVKSAQKDGTVGPMIGSIIIILVILIGGLYFLSSVVSSKKEQIQKEQVLQEQNDAFQVEQAAKQSSSDDVTSIETDLKATNIDAIGTELDEI